MPPKRVLIVDDSKDTVGFLRDALKSLDPTLWITVVSSGEDALIEVIHHPADLLVVDVRLPGISGFDLVKKTRASNRAVKAILISGLTDPDLEERARQSGADAFLPKPVELNELLSTVDSLMGLGKNLSAPEKVSVEKFSDAPARANHLPLTEKINAVRQRLGAETVLVVDANGRIAAQAGDLPETALMRAWVPAILENLSASLRASQSLGAENPENVLAFRGESFNVVAAPLGAGAAILVILMPSPAAVRFAVAVEELLDVQADLRRGIGEGAPAAAGKVLEPVLKKPAEDKTQPVPVSASTPQAAADAPGDLESLFKRGKIGLSTDQVDAFWDNLVEEKGKTAPANPDTLTYEQAVRMGLTSKEADG